MKKYAIAGGHEETLEAAKIILDNGGNAADAAVSALLTTMIAEPCMSSPGGGGIALIRTPEDNIYSLDFFCQTPKHKISREDEEFFPVTVDFGNTTEDFYIGAGSMAVPGSIAGVFDLHKEFGSMPIKELFDYAIGKAKYGSVVDAFQAYDIELLQEILLISGYGRHVFSALDGLCKEGDVLQVPDLADFLDVLSYEGKDFFYKGEVSQALDKLSKERGGHLRREDLQGYQTYLSSAISFPYRDAIVNTAAFPSRGGPIMAILLGILAENKKFDAFGKNHFELLKKALTETRKLMKEPLQAQIFLREKYGIAVPFHTELKSGGTTHFSILDGNGMAVAVTTSIGEGSGIWLEEAGIHMNNMLGEEALMENGYYNWRKDVRLMTMMTPTIVTTDLSDNILVSGSGGAGRIPYMLGELIHYMVDLRLSLGDATCRPRMFYDFIKTHVEPGFDCKLSDEVNLWDQLSLYFGGPHSVSKLKGGLQAMGDPRRYGVSLVV